MFVVNGVGKAISSRIADLFLDNTPWPQRLSRVGTIGTLEECLAVADNRSSEQRRQYVIGTARRIIESDPALSGARHGQALRAIPRSDRLYSFSHAYYVLQAETSALREEYFDLWDAYLATLGEGRRSASGQTPREASSLGPGLPNARRLRCGVQTHPHPGGLRDQLNTEQNNPTLNRGGLTTGDSPDRPASSVPQAAPLGKSYGSAGRRST
jgi:hypothetical protein